MLKLILSSIFTLGLATTALADDSFTGTWVTTGGSCTAKFEIRQTDTSLKIGRRIYRCGSSTTTLSEEEFELIDGNVTYNRNNIGVANNGIIKYSNIGNADVNRKFMFSIYPNPARGQQAKFQESLNDFYFDGKIQRK